MVITKERIKRFGAQLESRERAAGTTGHYLHAVQSLADYLDGRTVDKDMLLAWKANLMDSYAPTTVNAMIAGVNTFLRQEGLSHLLLKMVKVQRTTYTKHELTEQECQSLMRAAEQQKDLQALMIVVILVSTGIRAGEMKYITVEAVKNGHALIQNKGKGRDVPLPQELCKVLLAYTKQMGISSGAIIRSKRGNPLDRRRIWEILKALCGVAGVDETKVYPHAFRHLFARILYSLTSDIAMIADLLGHTKMETTVIYLRKTLSDIQKMVGGVCGKIQLKRVRAMLERDYVVRSIA